MSEPMAASGVQGKANVFQLVKNWYILLHAALAIFSPAKPRLEMFFCIVMLWHTMKLSCMSITQDLPCNISEEPFQITWICHICLHACLCPQTMALQCLCAGCAAFWETLPAPSLLSSYCLRQRSLYTRQRMA